MLNVYIKSIGILAPGIKHWDDMLKALTIAGHYQAEPLAKKLDTLLPANERRRATRITQLALYAAQQACINLNPAQCLQVFSSSNGDLTTFHRISQALALPGRPVSPTLFHNSVHNAPAGYWSIATQSQTASTSITAYSDSFAAGLLEAAVQLNCSDNIYNRDCLLVCYDEIPPSPFQPQIAITEEFACALVLSQKPENTLAQLTITIADGTQAATKLSLPALEMLRMANPQANALPILEALAQKNNTEIILPYFSQGLKIQLINLSHD